LANLTFLTGQCKCTYTQSHLQTQACTNTPTCTHTKAKIAYLCLQQHNAKKETVLYTQRTLHDVLAAPVSSDTIVPLLLPVSSRAQLSEAYLDAILCVAHEEPGAYRDVHGVHCASIGQHTIDKRNYSTTLLGGYLTVQLLHGGQTLNDGVSRPHTEANSGFNIPADSALVTNGQLAQQSIKSKRRHVETTSQNPKIQDGETVEHYHKILILNILLF